MGHGKTNAENTHEIDWERLACELERIPSLPEEEKASRGESALTEMILADAERRGAEEIRLHHPLGRAACLTPTVDLKDQYVTTDHWKVYFRLAGRTRPVMAIPSPLFPAITERLKELAALQDDDESGSLSLRMKMGEIEWTVDYKVEHRRSVRGESLVLVRDRDEPRKKAV